MATENQILDAAFAVYAVGQDNPTPDIAPPAGFQRLTGNQFTVVNELTGLVATTYRNPTTNEHIISFRGTASPSGAVADANRGWPQYQQSLSAVRSLLASVLAASPSQKVVLTGHSLGGALAQFAAYDFARTNANAGSRIEMVTWNSLGGRWALEEHVGDLATGATFDANLLDNRGVLSTHYFRFDDLVSRLGNGHLGGQPIMLGSDEENAFADILYAHMEEGLREGLERFDSFDASPAYININDDAQKVSGGIGAGLLNLAREQLSALPPNPTDNDRLNSMVLGSLLTFNAVQPMIGPIGGRAEVLNRTIQGAGEVVGAALEHLVKFGIDKGLGGQNTVIATVFSSVDELRSFFNAFNAYLDQANRITQDPTVDLISNIPVVGSVADQAREGVRAIVDLRDQVEDFIADIAGRFPNPANFAYKSTDLMADVGELLARAGAKINKLAVNTTANTQFELDLDVQWGAKHTTKLDGLLDLGDLLKVKSDGNLDLGVDARLKVKLGQDSDGFFVNTGLANPTAGGGYKNELSVGVDVDLNESTLKATLGGFLDFDVKDSTKDKEEASARANFDLTTTNANGKWRPSNGAIPVNSSLDSKVALDLGLTLSAFGSDPNLNFLPKLLADLKVDWGFQASSTQTKPTELECPTIKLDNIRLDLRELLGPQGFVSKVIGPVKDVASVVASVTGPLADPIQPLQNKSLADLLVSAGKINQATADSIKNVDQVADAVQSLAGRIDAIAEDGGEYKLGSIVLMEGGPGSSGKCSLSQAKLKERGTKPRGSSDQSPGREPKPQGWSPPQLQGQGGKEIEVNAALNTQITGGGIEFPLLSDPWSAIGLLFGADVDLFRFQLPTLSVQGNLDIPPFPIPNPFVPGLSAKVGGDLGVFAQLGGGYDTVGIRSMLESGNPLANLDDLFEGLYISDLTGNELEFKGRLSVAGGIEAGFASAYLGGGLSASVGVDLNDPDNDGKLRVAGMLKQPDFDFGSLFNFSGKLSAFAFVEGSLGLLKGRLDLGEVTLLEYQNPTNEPDRVNPGAPRNEDLLLHMGRNASLSGADAVGLGPDETARLFGIPNNNVVVTYGTLGVAKTFNVTGSISGFGDEGDDVLTVAGALSRPLTFDAGSGNDRVLSGGGSDSLLGEDGRDILHGRGGSDTILGGAGDDFLVPAGSSTNAADDEQIDSLDGGAGVDRLSYEFHGSALRIDLSSGAPVISVNDIARNIEEFGGGLGADTMIGGTLGDRFDGGGGNDTLSGGTGDDVLAGGEGFDTLNGGDGADALFGGANRDTLLGGNGDDALSGDAAADLLDGGANIDTAVYSDADVPVSVYLENAVLEQNGSITRRDGGGRGASTTASGDLLRSIENVTGSIFGDFLAGSNGGNLIDGGKGVDTMRGGLGDDVYVVDNAGDFVADEIQIFEPISGLFSPPSSFNPLEPVPTTPPPTRRSVFEQGGIDTVLSSVTFTLAVNLEHLVLTEPVAQPLVATAAPASIGSLLADRVKNWSPSASDWFTRAEGIKFLFQAPPAAIDGTGNAASNRIVGNAGANFLRGLAGSDTLDGGGGDDTLDGGEGADALRGGAGVNTVSYDASLAAVNVNLTTGAVSGGDAQGDTLTAVQNVIGSSGADSLVGSSAGNLLDGGGGNDTLVGGAGNDTYVLDSVFDRITETGSDAGDAVHAPFDLNLETFVGGVIEHARLTGENGAAVRGNAASNSLTGNNARNTLTGLAGNDFLDGAKGDDTMIGGAGDDTYVVENAGDIVAENASEGTDAVRSSIKHFKLDPNFEHLELTGTAEINGTGNERGNSLAGNSAANLLDGGAGADTMTGGAGNDTYVVDNIGDLVTEGTNAGADMVLSSIANALLVANFEHLRLTGTAAINGTGNALDNHLTGNSAANLLNGGAGADTMTGGAGNDTYVFDNKDDIAVETSDGGTDEVRTAIDLGGLALDANVENLVLTGTAAINGKGNALDNHLTGNSAANLLNGGAGADTMTGGAGNDTYLVDSSGDVVDDFVLVAPTLSGGIVGAPTIRSNAGIDEIVSGVDYTLPAFVENLRLRGSGATEGTGNSLANIIEGDFGNNLIDGGVGADTLIGSEGNDTFVVDNAGDLVFDGVFNPEGVGLANQGIDTVRSSVSFVLGDAATVFRDSAAGFLEHLELNGTAAINGTGNRLDNKLTGNTGNNSLAGLGGNDSLDGGAGADTMTGGAGNDTYVVDNAGDRVTENFNEGTDTVRSSVAHSLGLHFEHLVLTGAAAINGTGNASSNSLTGNSAANILTGGLGNDTYTVGAGDAVVEFADQGTDIVFSSATHTLSANVEHLVLTGGVRVISGTGNALPNSLTGNFAGNLLDGRGGADTMAGGLGNDTYVVDSDADRVTENAKGGVDTVRSSVTLTLGINLEHLELTGPLSIGGTGNALDNRITGNFGSNLLAGGDGNDTIRGAQGADTLTGGAGFDLLDGESGADSMAGGAGNDTYVVDDAGDILTENANEGTDTVRSLRTFTLGGNFEHLVLAGTTAINGTGNASNNSLTGNGAANILTGLAGDDYLDGGAGNDLLDGGLGDDTYVVDTAGDVVVEAPSAGTDTVRSSVALTLGTNFEHLVLTGAAAVSGTGNALDNRLIGNAGNNSLAGLGGNDLLDGGVGIDTMTGGAGNDTYVVQDSGDVVTESAGQGTDRVRSSVAFTLGTHVEHLELTGSGSINGTGNAGNNIIVGNLAGNLLDGGAGVDTMIGGHGDDTFIVDDARDLVLDGDAFRLDEGDDLRNTGVDTVRSFVSFTLADTASTRVPSLIPSMQYVSGFIENLELVGSFSINGTGNNLANSLTGNTANNRLDGLGGNDFVDGGAGADTMVGGLGNDTYVVDHADDRVTENANEGADTVRSTRTLTLGDNFEHLILTGAIAINGTGNDANNSLAGNAGSNILAGLAGNDFLDGAAGADTMVGGLGNDTYVVQDSGDVVTELTGQGTDTVRSLRTFTLGDNFEHLILTGLLAINGTGNAANNTLTGNAGNNSLTGLGGNDALEGDAGDDVLDGGAGADTMVGGAGDDIYHVDDVGDRLTEKAKEGTDTVRALITHTLGANFEHLVLTGAAAMSGTGNSLANSLAGNGASNVLTGLGGNDFLDGGAGADSMTGGQGNDTYMVDDALDRVTENADEGTDTVRTSRAHTLGANLEHLVLTGTVAVNGTGNARNNSLTGNAGNNSLDGRAGNDTLDGGAGDDVLDGGLGADFFVGGLGNDTFFVDDAGDSIAEEANAGTDTVISTASREMRPNLENLVLVGVSRIDGLGNDQANVITGNGGNNLIDGRGGSDTLSGCVVGANGGRREIDTLTGGAGNDLFQLGWSAGRFYDDGLPSFDGRGDYALITDFTVDQDKLQLDGAASNYLLGASPVASVTGSGLFHDSNANRNLDATDELIAIVRSANSTQLTTTNTIGTASFV